MNCYCSERERNPAAAESMRDIPAGYCGVCDVCGRPGHTCAHPSLPTTGAWCEDHWAELAAGPHIGLDRLFMAVIIAVAAAGAAVALYRLLS